MPWTRLEHTADLAVEVRAPSWPALLREAVPAFAHLVCDDPPGEESARVTRELLAEGPDPAAAWVAWWRGLHRLWILDGLLALSAEIAPGAAPQSSRAQLRCVPQEALAMEDCHDVKAITWHQALAAEESDAWRGRIVVDV